MRGQFCVSWVRMCQMLAAFSTSSGRLARSSTPAGCFNVLNAASIRHIGAFGTLGHSAHWGICTLGACCDCRLGDGGRGVALKARMLTQVLKPAKRYEHLTGLKSEKPPNFPCILRVYQGLWMHLFAHVPKGKGSALMQRKRVVKGNVALRCALSLMLAVGMAPTLAYADSLDAQDAASQPSVNSADNSTNSEAVALASFRSFGEGCEWMLDASGALTVRATDGVSGTLPAGTWPWADAIDQITSVVFEPGVKAGSSLSGLFNGA